MGRVQRAVQSESTAERKSWRNLARLAVVRGHLFPGDGGLLYPNFLSSGACCSFTFPVHKQQICEFKQVTFSEQTAFATFYTNKAQNSTCEDFSVFTLRFVTRQQDILK